MCPLTMQSREEVTEMQQHQLNVSASYNLSLSLYCFYWGILVKIFRFLG